MGERPLLAAERDPKRVGAEALRRVLDEPTPTTANIKEALARLELEGVAQVLELRRLRHVEVLQAGPEPPRRVLHVGIHPQSIEVVAHIVVMLDCRGVARARVATPDEMKGVGVAWWRGLWDVICGQQQQAV